ELQLSYPIDRGIIVDWDAMAKIYEHMIFDIIKTDPSDTLMLITEPPFIGKKYRSETAELLFEKFLIPGLHFEVQPICALYSTGRITGLVIDSGDGATQVVPAYEGYCISYSITRL